MCPFCKDKPCRIIEKPNGHIACECGRHSWPNSGAYDEDCRKASLTVVKAVHTWTQSY